MQRFQVLCIDAEWTPTHEHVVDNDAERPDIHLKRVSLLRI